MTERVWRQMLKETLRDTPHTPAQDAVVRLALSMLGADLRADLTAVQRQWIRDRLARASDGTPWAPLTVHEKARIRGPLLAYLATYHAKIYALVAAHFPTEEGHTICS